MAHDKVHKGKILILNLIPDQSNIFIEQIVIYYEPNK